MLSLNLSSSYLSNEKKNWAKYNALDAITKKKLKKIKQYEILYNFSSKFSKFYAKYYNKNIWFINLSAEIWFSVLLFVDLFSRASIDGIWYILNSYYSSYELNFIHEIMTIMNSFFSPSFSSDI